MKRYIPIILSLGLIFTIGYYVFTQKNLANSKRIKERDTSNIGTFIKQKVCARPPYFLQEMHIPQPVVIDLSQKVYKGVAFYYGKDFSKVLHPKIWEKYEHFSTYTVDEKGNIYLVPTPFISINPTTFNLQKNVYKLDTKTGKLSIFMHFDDIHPSSKNPYGINAITYDCDKKTLWSAAIDTSDYQSEKGRIYAMDIVKSEKLIEIKNVDALSMQILYTTQGKFLLVGSARDNGLYAYDITDTNKEYKRIKILELPLANERIRKIKIKTNNVLELQSVPFSYSLIAQSSKKERTFYSAKWSMTKHRWLVTKQ